MQKLIDYSTVNTTKGMFAAHLINARILISNGKLLAKEARRRFGKATNDERIFELFREVNETLTLAKRHGLTPSNPFCVHKGLEYGVVRGKLTFVKHFNRFRGV